MTIVAQVLTFIMVTRAVEEIFSMQEPVVTTYENVLNADARDEIGAYHFNDTGTIIAL